MISAICWIPKGSLKNVPFVDEPLTPGEIDEAIKSLSLDRGRDYDDNDMEIPDGDEEEEVGAWEDDVAQSVARVEEEDTAQAKAVASALRETAVGPSDCISAGLHELNMGNYDNEEGPDILGTGLEELYYPTNDMDPYLKSVDDSDDEEIEDKTVKPTDMIIVSLHNKELYNCIEVVLLEELEDGDLHMFPYNEIPLSHFPLCLAWSDCSLKDGQKEFRVGNFVAVGTMAPAIEIWDLDIIDCLEPHVVLGGKSKNKMRKNKAVTYRKGSHRDSILGIAWNTEYKNVLASAGADKTIKIWDVAVSKCVTTLEQHDSKVQAVVWSPCSSEMILSGSFDKTIALKDVKNCSPHCIRWSLEADVESLAWDPHNEHSFVVSLENGMVQAFDKRRASSSQNSSLAMFTLHAHEKAVSSVSFGPCTPNFLATASMDKMVKLWDLSNNQPSCISSLNPKVGVIFSVSFSNDNPFLLAVGGSKGNVKVWNTRTQTSVATKSGRFGQHDIVSVQ